MNDAPRPPGDQPDDQHRPNWGSAYPQQPAPGFPPPPGLHPSAAAPKQNDAMTAMVLGIVAVSGAFICVLPIVMSPFAWYLGAKSIREIDASGGALGGRSEAQAGKVLGIIGTVLLVLAVAAIVLLVVLSLSIDGFWDDDSYADAVLGSLRAAVGR